MLCLNYTYLNIGLYIQTLYMYIYINNFRLEYKVIQ